MSNFTSRKRSRSRFLPATKHDLERTKEQIMAAIDNLNTAVTALTVSVDAAVAKLGTVPGGATDAQVQAAADAVTAQSVKLDSAVTPPPVPAP